MARWGDGEGDNKEQFIQGDLYKKKEKKSLRHVIEIVFNSRYL